MDLSNYLKIETINDVRLYAHSFSLASKKLLLTTYFLTLRSDEKDFELMIKSIDAIRFLESAAERRYTPMLQGGSTLVLFTKDFHVYELTVPTFSEARALHQSLELLSNIESLSSHYPFLYKPDFHIPTSISTCYPEGLTELIASGTWRNSQVNQDYAVCSSYPSSVLVPSKVDDQILIESGKFRQGGRFPILLYYHKPRQTTLLVGAEPFNGITSSSSSASLISSGSNSVINSLAAAVSSVASTSSPASKPAGTLLGSSMARNPTSSFMNSQSSNRCRADELLLAAVLPDRGRGAILDLRSQTEVKKSTSTGTSTESEQYYAQWRKIRRPMENATNLNTAFRKLIEVCTSSGRYSKSSNTPFGPLQTGTLTDSMNLLSTAASTPFATFINENLSQSIKSMEVTNSENDPSYHSLDIMANDPASNVSFPDSQFSGFSTESPSNNASLIQSTNLRRIGVWLSLVREALGAAVAGALALDARDAFAQQQLQQEQCLLAQKRKEEQLQRMRNRDNSDIRNTNGDAQVIREEAKLRGSSLLIQSRTGRDRALLVAGLIQIILNPESRTIKGFQSLIDHTWIAPGHPFSERCQYSAFGSKSGKSDAPFFILFLDCVWQLLRQYPNAFEFTDEFLCLLAKHAYFSEFGTFIGNSMQEREELEVDRKTASLWAYVNQPTMLSHYRNVFYAVQDGSNEQLADNYACWPCLAPQALDVWQELYQDQLIGDSDNLWSRPRQMTRLVIDRFAAEQARAIRLRKILETLQEEAVKSKLLISEVAQAS